MSFEKEFPSLKGKECYVDEFKFGDKPTEEVISGVLSGKPKKEVIELAPEPNEFRGRTYNFVEGKVYPEEDIKKHCLDKEKVREVIDKFLFDTAQHHKQIEGQCDFRDYLKKELGLEDEPVSNTKTK